MLELIKESRAPRTKDLTHTIGFSDSLFLSEEVFLGSDLVADEQLSIISKSSDETELFKKYIEESKQFHGSVKGTYFLYKHPNPNQYFFEAEDKIRLFSTAVKIYYGKFCELRSFIHFVDEKYYEPFIHEKTYSYHYEDGITIESDADFNNIKKIYSNLLKAKIDKFTVYSKIHNGVTFINKSFETAWILLRILFSVAVLESLFSDESKNEIVYKISLRTAHFLHADNAEERQKTFKFIKRAYAIRSCFVHGSNVEKEVDKLSKIFRKEDGNESYSFYLDFPPKLDSLVSQCLSKILLDDSLFAFFNNEKIPSEEETNFYDSLVLK